MAILLDRADTSKVVQILGEIPDGDGNELSVTLDSVYDDDSFTNEIQVTQEGPWIRSTIQKALVPKYSGLYNLSLAIENGRLLTLSQIDVSLSELAVSLSNIRSGRRENFIDNLLTSVVGDDNIQTVDSGITSTAEEAVIPVGRIEQQLQVEVIESSISLTTVESAISISRQEHDIQTDIVESPVISTTQENEITLGRTENVLVAEVIENNISLSRLENTGTTTRITHHP